MTTGVLPWLAGQVWIWLRSVNRRLGRRGRSLLFVSYLSLAFMALLAAPSAGTVAALGALFPLPVWAVLWAATGIVCAVGAFAIRDRWAYTTAIAMVTLWALLYLVSWWPAGTNPRGWIAAAIYAPFSLFLVNIAGWAEPVTAEAEALEEGYPSGVVTADSAGAITGWYGSAQQIFGWHAAEVIGRPLTILMPDRYRAAHQAAVADLDATGRTRAGRTLYVQGLHHDGHEIPLSIYVKVSDTGTGHVLSAVVRNSGPDGPPWPGEAIPP